MCTMISSSLVFVFYGWKILTDTFITIVNHLFKEYFYKKITNKIGVKFFFKLIISLIVPVRITQFYPIEYLRERERERERVPLKEIPEEATTQVWITVFSCLVKGCLRRPDFCSNFAKKIKKI